MNAEAPRSPSGPPPDESTALMPSTPSAPRRGRGLVVVVALLLTVGVSGTIVTTRALRGDPEPGGGRSSIESIRDTPVEAWSYDSWRDGDGDILLDSIVPVSGGDFAAVISPRGDPGHFGIAMVDGDTGEDRWTVTPESIGLPSDGVLDLFPVSPEGHLPVIVEERREGDDALLWIAALDLSDGSVVSQTVRTGHRPSPPWGAEGVEEDPYGTSDPGRQALVIMAEGEVLRLDTSDLDGEPLWSVETAAARSVTSVDGHVHVEGSPDMWLDAETGIEPEWSQDLGPTVRYLPSRFGDMVLRTTALRSEDRIDSEGIAEWSGIQLEMLDADGNVLWTVETDASHVVSSPEGWELFISDWVDPATEQSHRHLMRLDPATGEPVWEENHEEFDELMPQLVGGKLVLRDGERGVLIDGETGGRIHVLEHAPQRFAEDVMYVQDGQQVQGWDAADGRLLWSLPVSPIAQLGHIGPLLVLWNFDGGPITRLR